jgi:hypothetical protein
MLPQRMKKAITDNPKKLANLIDLVNLPSTLREFVGQSQISRLGCFMQVWSYIKTNNLQVLTTPFLFQHFSNESDFFLFQKKMIKKKKKNFPLKEGMFSISTYLGSVNHIYFDLRRFVQVDL